MGAGEQTLPDWERLLAAERHVQALVPGTVLVGGTAAALHAGHRRSHDGDHVLADLRDRFDDVLAALEGVAGWRTARVQRPVLVLGGLDGIATGIRQLRRSAPLDALYPQPLASVTAEVVERLASAGPADLAEVELVSYRGLVAPWNRWEHLKERGRHFAQVLVRELLGGTAP